LVKRIESRTVREVYHGHKPDHGSDGTALYVQQTIAQYPNVQVTRLARGLATGATSNTRTAMSWPTPSAAAAM